MENEALIDPTKRKIIDLTFYAFNQKGYKAVSMDLVSRELRISKKTIYKHFQTKEEILETAMLELFSELEIKIGLVQESLSPQEVLLGFFASYKQFLLGFSRRLKTEISAWMPHLKDRIDNFENQVLKAQFANWLKASRKSGLLEYPSTTRDLTNVLFSVMAGMAESPEEKAHFLLLAMLKGISVKKKKKK